MGSTTRLTGKLGVLAVSGVILMTACGGDDTPTTQPPGETATPTEAVELVDLRISATLIDTLPFMAALKLADDRGYYEEEGINVEFASAAGGGSTLRALSTGDADMSIGAPGASVLAAQAEPNLKIVSLWAPANGFYWLGTDQVDDLDGASVGGSVPGSTVNLLLSGIEEEMGVTFKEIVPAGGMGENWAASRSGQVVGGWAMEPFVTQQVENEGAVVVIDAPRYIEWFPADMVVVTEEYAEENPEALQGFFRAAERIFDDFVNDAPGIAEELSSIMNIDAGVIERSLTESDVSSEDLYSFRTVPEALETVSHLMQISDQIDAPVDWAQIFDQQYLPDNAKSDL